MNTILLLPRDGVESNESPRPLHISASKVDKLTLHLLQKTPNRCLVLFYCTLARLFQWWHQVVRYLECLEQRTNKYYAFSQSYIWVQDVTGGLPKRVDLSCCNLVLPTKQNHNSNT